ncbi:hypothetical protein E1262_23835 [Jiangella aurantiaca]|uniref:Toxin-antitoxin system HicB family antitoxin n=1 Tax=Jiangella aurantiaca TaxID=2530373 RepID=A0A4R5A472_9ACTN|nr:hypothetical protein [Jiangella aurantiaca]TDD65850.1 hypothetical protein E1262_23835 [Jiangella aurantiaca]
MASSGADGGLPARRRERHAVLLRLDPAVHEALTRWAQDEFRSVNAQVELVLRNALRAAGRAPNDAGPLPRRGRPPSPTPADELPPADAE